MRGCWVTLVLPESLWASGLWPTRLLYPWHSPSKNTAVGCHALLQRKIPRNQTQVSCIAGRFFTTSKPLNTVNESESCSVVSDSSRPHGLYSPWNSPGQNTGMGSLSLLQGIFPTQGSNPGLPHCRQILYQLSHKGSPKILEWVAYPFSRRSSHPRNQTGVSCIAGGFLPTELSGKPWIQKEVVKCLRFKDFFTYEINRTQSKCKNILSKLETLS